MDNNSMVDLSREAFEKAMKAAGWEPVTDLLDRINQWRFVNNGKVLWDEPLWLGWDGGAIDEPPF